MTLSWSRTTLHEAWSSSSSSSSLRLIAKQSGLLRDWTFYLDNKYAYKPPVKREYKTEFFCKINISRRAKENASIDNIFVSIRSIEGNNIDSIYPYLIIEWGSDLKNKPLDPVSVLYASESFANTDTITQSFTGRRRVRMKQSVSVMITPKMLLDEITSQFDQEDKTNCKSFGLKIKESLNEMFTFGEIFKRFAVVAKFNVLYVLYFEDRKKTGQCCGFLRCRSQSHLELGIERSYAFTDTSQAVASLIPQLSQENFDMHDRDYDEWCRIPNWNADKLNQNTLSDSIDNFTEKRISRYVRWFLENWSRPDKIANTRQPVSALDDVWDLKIAVDRNNGSIIVKIPKVQRNTDYIKIEERGEEEEKEEEKEENEISIKKEKALREEPVQTKEEIIRLKTEFKSTHTNILVEGYKEPSLGAIQTISRTLGVYQSMSNDLMPNIQDSPFTRQFATTKSIQTRDRPYWDFVLSFYDPVYHSVPIDPLLERWNLDDHIKPSNSDQLEVQIWDELDRVFFNFSKEDLQKLKYLSMQNSRQRYEVQESIQGVCETLQLTWNNTSLRKMDAEIAADKRSAQGIIGEMNDEKVKTKTLNWKLMAQTYPTFMAYYYDNLLRLGVQLAARYQNQNQSTDAAAQTTENSNLYSSLCYSYFNPYYSDLSRHPTNASYDGFPWMAPSTKNNRRDTYDVLAATKKDGKMEEKAIEKGKTQKKDRVIGNLLENALESRLKYRRQLLVAADTKIHTKYALGVETIEKKRKSKKRDEDKRKEENMKRRKKRDDWRNDDKTANEPYPPRFSDIPRPEESDDEEEKEEDTLVTMLEINNIGETLRSMIFQQGREYDWYSKKRQVFVSWVKALSEWVGVEQSQHMLVEDSRTLMQIATFLQESRNVSVNLDMVMTIDEWVQDHQEWSACLMTWYRAAMTVLTEPEVKLSSANISKLFDAAVNFKLLDFFDFHGVEVDSGSKSWPTQLFTGPRQSFAINNRTIHYHRLSIAIIQAHMINVVYERENIPSESLPDKIIEATGRLKATVFAKYDGEEWSPSMNNFDDFNHALMKGYEQEFTIYRKAMFIRGSQPVSLHISDNAAIASADQTDPPILSSKMPLSFRDVTTVAKKVKILKAGGVSFRIISLYLQTQCIDRQILDNLFLVNIACDSQKALTVKYLKPLEKDKKEPFDWDAVLRQSFEKLKRAFELRNEVFVTPRQPLQSQLFDEILTYETYFLSKATHGLSALPESSDTYYSNIATASNVSFSQLWGMYFLLFDDPLESKDFHEYDDTGSTTRFVISNLRSTMKALWATTQIANIRPFAGWNNTLVDSQDEYIQLFHHASLQRQYRQFTTLMQFLATMQPRTSNSAQVVEELADKQSLLGIYQTIDAVYHINDTSDETIDADFARADAESLSLENEQTEITSSNDALKTAHSQLRHSIKDLLGGWMYHQKRWAYWTNFFDFISKNKSDLIHRLKQMKFTVNNEEFTLVSKMPALNKYFDVLCEYGTFYKETTNEIVNVIKFMREQVDHAERYKVLRIRATSSRLVLKAAQTWLCSYQEFDIRDYQDEFVLKPRLGSVPTKENATHRPLSLFLILSNLWFQCHNKPVDVIELLSKFGEMFKENIAVMPVIDASELNPTFSALFDEIKDWNQRTTAKIVQTMLGSPFAKTLKTFSEEHMLHYAAAYAWNLSIDAPVELESLKNISTLTAKLLVEHDETFGSFSARQSLDDELESGLSTLISAVDRFHDSNHNESVYYLRSELISFDNNTATHTMDLPIQKFQGRVTNRKYHDREKESLEENTALWDMTNSMNDLSEDDFREMLKSPHLHFDKTNPISLRMTDIQTQNPTHYYRKMKRNFIDASTYLTAYRVVNEEEETIPIDQQVKNVLRFASDPNAQILSLLNQLKGISALDPTWEPKADIPTPSLSFYSSSSSLDPIQLISNLVVELNARQNLFYSEQLDHVATDVIQPFLNSLSLFQKESLVDDNGVGKVIIDDDTKQWLGFIRLWLSRIKDFDPCLTEKMMDCRVRLVMSAYSKRSSRKRLITLFTGQLSSKLSLQHTLLVAKKDDNLISFVKGWRETDLVSWESIYYDLISSVAYYKEDQTPNESRESRWIIDQAIDKISNTSTVDYATAWFLSWTIHVLRTSSSFLPTWLAYEYYTRFAQVCAMFDHRESDYANTEIANEQRMPIPAMLLGRGITYKQALIVGCNALIGITIQEDNVLEQRRRKYRSGVSHKAWDFYKPASIVEEYTNEAEAADPIPELERVTTEKITDEMAQEDMVNFNRTKKSSRDEDDFDVIDDDNEMDQVDEDDDADDDQKEDRPEQIDDVKREKAETEQQIKVSSIWWSAKEDKTDKEADASPITFSDVDKAKEFHAKCKGFETTATQHAKTNFTKLSADDQEEARDYCASQRRILLLDIEGVDELIGSSSTKPIEKLLNTTDNSFFRIGETPLLEERKKLFQDIIEVHTNTNAGPAKRMLEHAIRVWLQLAEHSTKSVNTHLSSEQQAKLQCFSISARRQNHFQDQPHPYNMRRAMENVYFLIMQSDEITVETTRKVITYKKKQGVAAEEEEEEEEEDYSSDEEEDDMRDEEEEAGERNSDDPDANDEQPDEEIDPIMQSEEAKRKASAKGDAMEEVAISRDNPVPLIYLVDDDVISRQTNYEYWKKQAHIVTANNATNIAMIISLSKIFDVEELTKKRERPLIFPKDSEKAIKEISIAAKTAFKIWFQSYAKTEHSSRLFAFFDDQPAELRKPEDTAILRRVMRSEVSMEELIKLEKPQNGANQLFEWITKYWIDHANEIMSVVDQLRLQRLIYLANTIGNYDLVPSTKKKNGDKQIKEGGITPLVEKPKKKQRAEDKGEKSKKKSPEKEEKNTLKRKTVDEPSKPLSSSSSSSSSSRIPKKPVTSFKPTLSIFSSNKPVQFPSHSSSNSSPSSFPTSSSSSSRPPPSSSSSFSKPTNYLKDFDEKGDPELDEAIRQSLSNSSSSLSSSGERSTHKGKRDNRRETPYEREEKKEREERDEREEKEERDDREEREEREMDERKLKESEEKQRRNDSYPSSSSSYRPSSSSSSSLPFHSSSSSSSSSSSPSSLRFDRFGFLLPSSSSPPYLSSSLFSSRPSNTSSSSSSSSSPPSSRQYEDLSDDEVIQAPEEITRTTMKETKENRKSRKDELKRRLGLFAPEVTNRLPTPFSSAIGIQNQVLRVPNSKESNKRKEVDEREKQGGSKHSKMKGMMKILLSRHASSLTRSEREEGLSAQTFFRRTQFKDVAQMFMTLSRLQMSEEFEIHSLLNRRLDSLAGVSIKAKMICRKIELQMNRSLALGMNLITLIALSASCPESQLDELSESIMTNAEALRSLLKDETRVELIRFHKYLSMNDKEFLSNWASDSLEEEESSGPDDDALLRVEKDQYLKRSDAIALLWSAKELMQETWSEEEQELDVPIISRVIELLKGCESAQVPDVFGAIALSMTRWCVDCQEE